MDYDQKSTDLGFAQLDLDRVRRRGCPETVFCQGKSPEQIAVIFERFAEFGQRVLGTRATPEQFEYLQKRLPDLQYHETARLLTLGPCQGKRRWGQLRSAVPGPVICPWRRRRL